MVFFFFFIFYIFILCRNISQIKLKTIGVTDFFCSQLTKTQYMYLFNWTFFNLNKEFVKKDISDSVSSSKNVNLLNDDLKITTVYSAYPWLYFKQCIIVCIVSLYNLLLCILLLYNHCNDFASCGTLIGIKNIFILYRHMRNRK